MSERRNILVTGATGFLGSHLAARMLQDGYHVTALARGSKTASPKARVEDVLRDVGVQQMENLEVVEGDISSPGLQLNEADKKKILATTDEVWHCAASLSFEEEDREEIFRMNVDGTRNMLDLLRQTRTQGSIT